MSHKHRMSDQKMRSELAKRAKAEKKNQRRSTRRATVHLATEAK
jgi:hypothetical protein